MPAFFSFTDVTEFMIGITILYRVFSLKCFERSIKECARPILVPGFFFLGKMVMM